MLQLHGTDRLTIIEIAHQAQKTNYRAYRRVSLSEFPDFCRQIKIFCLDPDMHTLTSRDRRKKSNFRTIGNLNIYLAQHMIVSHAQCRVRRERLSPKFAARGQPCTDITDSTHFIRDVDDLFCDT